MLEFIAESQAVIELDTDRAIYTVPAEHIDTDALIQQFGGAIDPQDIVIHIEVAIPPDEMISVVENAAERGSFTLILQPISFTVKATYGDTTVEAVRFLSFVERAILLPDEIDPETVTTAIVVEANGTIRHVPTRITQIDGRNAAVINSMTNSTYALIGNGRQFTDVSNHWAEAAIEVHGSSSVVTPTACFFRIKPLRALNLPPSSCGDWG